MRPLRAAAAVVPRPAAGRVGARGGRGAPRPLLVLPPPLRVRGEAADVRSPERRRRADAAGAQTEARRPPRRAVTAWPKRLRRKAEPAGESTPRAPARG